MGKGVIDKIAFFIFVAFFIATLLIASFQVNILSHELYHFYSHSPQSSAICFERDLSTSVVAFTVHEEKVSFKGADHGEDAGFDSYYQLEDAEEEHLANTIGFASSLSFFLIGSLLLILLTIRLRK
ncbi:hypothetical protein JW968_05210 [Candidatus Woesearchaeota archaeon]|nr:hypothetical protein [Candidatus Woesearchaeota archaeon]